MKAEQKFKGRSGIIIIAIGLLIAALIGLIVYFLFFRKTKIIIRPQHINVPFPYIFNKNFYEKLTSFVNQGHYTSSLLIYGPEGVGKTTGINEFSHKLIENGQLAIVFKFDSLSRYATKSDLMKQIHHSISSAFRELDGKHYNSTTLREFFPLIHAFADFTDKKELFSFNTASDQNNEKNTKRRFKSISLHDINLQRVAEFLLSIKLDSLLGVRAFFEALDALVPLLHPSIFVINSENLLSTEERKMDFEISQFGTNFLTSVERFANENRSLPIIFEVSDERALFDHRFPSDRTFLKQFQVKEFSAEDSKQVLIKEKNIFRQEEYSVLTDSLGFNGRLLSEAHFLMGEGLTAQESIKEIMDQEREVIGRILLKGNQTENLRYAKMLSSNSNFNKENDAKTQNENDTMDVEKISFRFLRWRLGSLTNSSTIAVQNKMTEKLLREFVDFGLPKK